MPEDEKLPPNQSETFRRAFEARLRGRLKPFEGKPINRETIAKIREETLAECRQIVKDITGKDVKPEAPLRVRFPKGDLPRDAR